MTLRNSLKSVSCNKSAILGSRFKIQDNVLIVEDETAQHILHESQSLKAVLMDRTPQHPNTLLSVTEAGV